MKTKEELNALKEEIEAMNRKLHELTEEELAQVSGGQFVHPISFIRSRSNTFQNLISDFIPLIIDIRNQTDLFNEFNDKMMYIGNTQLMEYPNDEYWFTFEVYKDGNDQIFPYVYQSGTLTVGRKGS